VLGLSDPLVEKACVTLLELIERSACSFVLEYPFIPKRKNPTAHNECHCKQYASWLNPAITVLILYEANERFLSSPKL